MANIIIIRQKLGSLAALPPPAKRQDKLLLEWFELSKRIMHKKTASGRAVTLRFLENDPGFSDGDILYEDETSMIVVELSPTDTIVLHPDGMMQMAALCYEIGNKHLPLFLEGDEVLVPFDAPLFRQLENSGYRPERQSRKLVNAIRTSVAPHSDGTSLFSRIIQRTTASGG